MCIFANNEEEEKWLLQSTLQHRELETLIHKASKMHAEEEEDDDDENNNYNHVNEEKEKEKKGGKNGKNHVSTSKSSSTTVTTTLSEKNRNVIGSGNDHDYDYDYDHDQWIDRQLRAEARKALLSDLPSPLMHFFASYDPVKTTRLSLLRLFEQLQDELMCKNMCLHLLDVLIAKFFPSIQVWSQLVVVDERDEEEDEEDEEGEKEERKKRR